MSWIWPCSLFSLIGSLWPIRPCKLTNVITGAKLPVVIGLAVKCPLKQLLNHDWAISNYFTDDHGCAICFRYWWLDILVLNPSFPACVLHCRRNISHCRSFFANAVNMPPTLFLLQLPEAVWEFNCHHSQMVAVRYGQMWKLPSTSVFSAFDCFLFSSNNFTNTFCVSLYWFNRCTVSINSK